MTFFQARRASDDGNPILVNVHRIEAVTAGPEGEALIYLIAPGGSSGFDKDDWDGGGKIRCVEKYQTIRKRIAKALGGGA